MYKVIWLWDGCPGKDATIPLATVDEAKNAVRNLERRHRAEFERYGYKLELGIVDLETERLISYVAVR